MELCAGGVRHYIRSNVINTMVYRFSQLESTLPVRYNYKLSTNLFTLEGRAVTTNNRMTVSALEVFPVFSRIMSALDRVHARDSQFRLGYLE